MNKEFFRLLENMDINKLDMVYSSPNGITVLKSSEYNFRLNQINKLEKDKKELQQRIDEVIKYIKESEEEYGYLEDCEKTILEILKGGNNE